MSADELLIAILWIVEMFDKSKSRKLRINPLVHEANLETFYGVCVTNQKHRSNTPSRRSTKFRVFIWLPGTGREP